MATTISNALRSAMIQQYQVLIDAGSGPGVVEIRTGAKPASVATAASGTLLGTLTLSDPSAPAAVNGVLTFNAVTSDASADASGNAGWFRVKDSAGNAIADGTITATGGGGDMTLDNIAIVAGGVISITAWTATQPAG